MLLRPNLTGAARGSTGFRGCLYSSGAVGSPCSRTRRLPDRSPLIGGLWRREYLDVVDVADLLVGVDVYQTVVIAKS
jgi:hypothetical protein